MSAPTHIIRGTQAHRAVRGQSTVEFVVASLALVPLFLLVPLVGKIIDMTQAAESASRYLAFEATVHRSGQPGHGRRSDADLAAEVRRRFFGASNAPVKTGDTAGDFPADRNALWVDPFGRPLIEQFDRDVDVASAIESKDVVPAVDAHTKALGFAPADLYTGNVLVHPRNVAGIAPFDTIDLAIARRAAILVDAGAVSGPDDVRSRYRHADGKFNPSATADPLHLIDWIGQLPKFVLDPSFALDDFDWDAVPRDRLQ